VLERPPIAYVIAQVKFSAVAGMEKYIAAVQEELRKNSLPRLVTGQLTNIRFAPSMAAETTVTPRWEFQDRNKTSGVILSTDFIALHLTNYSGFDDFCQRFRRALDVVHRIVGVELIDRIGLRYVDLIRGSEGRDLREYVNPGLMGIPDDAVSATKSSCFVNYVAQTASGTLSIRALQRDDGQVLPPDLQPGTLASATMGISVGDKALTLDIDSFRDFQDKPDEFSPRVAVDWLWRLHGDAIRAFCSAVTAPAMAEWGFKRTA